MQSCAKMFSKFFDAFDEQAIFLEDFFFEVAERLSQIIDATFPSGVTGEAVVAYGVTISVGFLIPYLVLLLCWSNFRFNRWLWFSQLSYFYL